MRVMSSDRVPPGAAGEKIKDHCASASKSLLYMPDQNISATDTNKKKKEIFISLEVKLLSLY